MVQSRFGNSSTLSAVVLLLASSCFSFSLHPQLGPLSDPAQAPQAQTQEELDAYLEIASQTTPQQIVIDVDAFAARFPESKLLGIAYQYQMHAFQQLGKFDGVLTAGQKALAANPENVNTLLTLAPVIANGAMQRPDRDQLLAQAESYAKQALIGIDKIRPPHKISLEQWELEKRSMQCSAYETLGVIALDRGDAKTAISEFEATIPLPPAADGTRFFRLGVAYASDGRAEDAKKSFQRAVELGPETVRKLAIEQLDALEKRESISK
jgi:tetratricopeptide (TPR) repeat protein